MKTPYADRAREILFSAVPDKRGRLDALFVDWKKQFGPSADEMDVKLTFDAMLEDVSDDFSYFSRPDPSAH